MFSREIASVLLFCSFLFRKSSAHKRREHRFSLGFRMWRTSKGEGRYENIENEIKQNCYYEVKTFNIKVLWFMKILFLLPLILISIPTLSRIDDYILPKNEFYKAPDGQKGKDRRFFSSLSFSGAFLHNGWENKLFRQMMMGCPEKKGSIYYTQKYIYWPDDHVKM